MRCANCSCRSEAVKKRADHIRPDQSMDDNRTVLSLILDVLLICRYKIKRSYRSSVLLEGCMSSNRSNRTQNGVTMGEGYWHRRLNDSSSSRSAGGRSVIVLFKTLLNSHHHKSSPVTRIVSSRARMPMQSILLQRTVET